MLVGVVYPLCPAGHLPHKEGDRQDALVATLFSDVEMGKTSPHIDLPTCGGDARQGRGG